MKFNNVVDDILAGVEPLAALERHDQFLRPRPSDLITKDSLHQGNLTISRQTYRVRPGEVHDVLPRNDRGALLEFNSLRFVDPLRRARSSEDDKRLWLEYVTGWQESLENQGPEGVAYLPASQRGVVLALGLRDFWPADAIVPASLTSLLNDHLSIYTEKLRSGRVHLVEETLVRGVGAMSMASDNREAIDSIVSTFEEMYLFDGLAPGGTVTATSETTRRWAKLADVLRRKSYLQTDADPTRGQEHSEISNLWVHATRPDGTITPSGSAEYQQKWDDVVPRTAAEKYAATMSNSGEASDDLLYTNKSGWAFGRSGWGETERDFDEETHFSFRFGHLESLGRHEDCTSLTFSAMGVNWVDDNPGSQTSEDESPWSKRDHHSCVSIEGRYRSHGDAELTRKRTTDSTFDLEARDRSYLPVAMTRRLVYSRSGDYLVVIDQSRSADPHMGAQNWIIPPECVVHKTPTGVTLERGDASCELVWLNVPSPEVSIETLGDSQDGWKRISVPIQGTSVRLITAIIPRKTNEQIDCRRLPLGDGVISVVVTRPKHGEQLIITKEGVGIGSTNTEPEELTERVRNKALTGGLSRNEELQLRSSIRREITQIKNDLWNESPNLIHRERALNKLTELAQNSKVSGLRDYGIGSAMIDIAGSELRSRIDKHPLVSGKKRSPIISWNKDTPLIHDFYQVPIRTFRSLSDDIDEKLEKQMLTFDLGQLTLPILLSRVSTGNTLNVMFHGSTDRSRNAMPRFERVRSMENLGNGPTVFVSDPCLDLDASQILTWYMGSEELNLHEILAAEIDLLARRLGCDRILYVGNSGGGFAALQVASYSNVSGVVTFNPQIQIDKYVPRIARTAQEVVFGEPSVSNNSVLKSRVDAIQRYSDIGFDKKVYFIQNTGDEMHYQNHFNPFQLAFERSEHPQKFKAITPYLGPGHRVPPPAEYFEHVLEGAEFVFGSN